MFLDILHEDTRHEDVPARRTGHQRHHKVPRNWLFVHRKCYEKRELFRRFCEPTAYAR